MEDFIKMMKDDSFNRTIQELKYFFCGNLFVIEFAFNPTIQELKSASSTTAYQYLTFNRTIQELKCLKTGLQSMAIKSFNRTIQELKWSERK